VKENGSESKREKEFVCLCDAVNCIVLCQQRERESVCVCV